MPSAFFTKPEDYAHVAPYTHPLLCELRECTWFLHRLITNPSEYLPTYPDIRDRVKDWRAKMFQALMLFYQDAVGQTTALSRLAPDPKVSILRAFHAIQTYATLIQQIREARAEFEGAQAHAGSTSMTNIWLEMCTDLRTVEYRMKCFIKRGEVPEDTAIDIMLTRSGDMASKSSIHSNAFLSSAESTKAISAPLQSYSDQSAFLDIPEDYDTVPFSHRLLEPLLAAKAGLERLAQTPRHEAGPSPREHLTAWRRETLRALTAFHRDVFEPSTLRNITTGSSSKVKVIRALFAIRCYATLMEQIDATKQVLRSVPDSRMKPDARLAARADLETVKVRIDRFFMKGVKPIDRDVLLDEVDGILTLTSSSTPRQQITTTNNH